jgi:hypothetical protein
MKRKVCVRLAVVVTLHCVAVLPSIAFAQLPPQVADFNIGQALRGVVLEETVHQINGSPPITWDNFEFVSFFPTRGFGSGPHFNAIFDPGTQLFHWDTFASPPGFYEWSVRATNEFGSDTGTIRVDLFVPEPASFATSALGMLAFACLRRRR